MGVEFPIYNEPKAKLYWPPEALPFACAKYCVDIVLKYSQAASEAYYEAVKALELPGCQALIREANTNAPVTISWTKRLLMALFKNSEMPGIPRLWREKYNKYRDNADYLEFIECLRKLVRIGFNRPKDIENAQYRVSLEGAPFLFAFLILRTIANYCKVKLEDWNKYRRDKHDQIMTGSPTTREERLRKHEIIQVYKRHKWTLRHDRKLLGDADRWYKCRVNPGTIDAYLNELARQTEIDLEYSNVQRTLAPYDEATGYPRQWRD
jgi:hypothetical protein